MIPGLGAHKGRPYGCVQDDDSDHANHSPREGESQKPSRQAKADAVGGDKVAACGIALKLSGRQAANAAGCLKRR